MIGGARLLTEGPAVPDGVGLRLVTDDDGVRGMSVMTAYP